MKNVLVVGGTGNIGPYLLKSLTLKKINCISTSTKKPASTNYQFNLATDSIESLLNLHSKIDYCTILAGITNIDLCKKNNTFSNLVNVEGTKKLINDLVRLNIKPIFISSDAVFGEGRGHSSEEDMPSPNTTYGKQKLEVEQYLQSIAKNNYLIIRLSKVYSSNPYDSTLFSQWYRDIISNKHIFCSTDQIFNPTYVLDVAEGIVQLIKNNHYGKYHLANPVTWKRIELLTEFISFGNLSFNKIKEGKVSELNLLDDRPRNSSISSNKFIKSTNFKFTELKVFFEVFFKNINSINKHNLQI